MPRKIISAFFAFYLYASNQLLASDLKIPTAIDSQYMREYITVGKGDWNPEIEKLVINDELFKKGNNLLTNKTTYVTKEVGAGDPENPKTKMTKKMIEVPDIKNALQILRDSAISNNNPVSAYEVLTISLAHYGKGNTNPFVADFPKLSKLLYDKKVCIGYLHYGEFLESQNNFSGAYSVFKSGYEQIKCDGWYQAVLGGKMSKLRKASEK